jgi:hypothetical protein
MAKANKPKKETKKRSEHYDPKLKTSASFDDLINLSVNKPVAKKDTEKKG